MSSMAFLQKEKKIKTDKKWENRFENSNAAEIEIKKKIKEKTFRKSQIRALTNAAV